MAQLPLCILITVLALFLQLSAAVPSSTPKSDLLGASVTKDFTDVCNLLGPYIAIPDVQTDQLCATTGFTNDTDMGVLLNLVERGMMRLTEESKGPFCSADKQSPSATTSLQGESSLASSGSAR